MWYRLPWIARAISCPNTPSASTARSSPPPEISECPEEDAREVSLWLKAKMRRAMEEVLGKELGGPKSVEVEYGPSWAESTEEL